ncbi:MAG: amidohydrolase family protein [Opitutaceae bacterium]
MTSTLQARHYLTAEPIDVVVADGTIAEIRPAIDQDTSLPWIAPGLVDIQVNGFAGVDFNRPLTDARAWDKACRALLNHGCTHFLATLITNERSAADGLLAGLTEAINRTSVRNCVGFHMEGPFLNPDPGYRGAHHPDWMTPPDTDLLERWQEISGQSVRMVTLAPECAMEAALPFIRAATAGGIRIAIGHSSAMGKTLDEAIRAGADLWTHLGNATPDPNAKFENVIFHTLSRPGLMASVIPDGHHIPPHALSVICRALGDRLILITDAMTGAGAPPGRYTICHLEIDIGEDGIARMPDSGRLAGSTLTPFETVFRAARLTGLPWSEMWTAMSTRPADWLGLSHRLEVGSAASFCLFQVEPQPRLRATWLNGNAFPISMPAQVERTPRG